MADRLVTNSSTFLASGQRGVPHGDFGAPRGTNQAHADGSVRWVPLKNCNYFFSPNSYNWDRGQYVPYRAEASAQFNRGGYPSPVACNGIWMPLPSTGWFGISTNGWGGCVAGGTYLP